MKKWICILGAMMLVIGYSTNAEIIDPQDTSQSKALTDSRSDVLYIRDDIKEVIEEINALREKYSREIEDGREVYVYVNIYEDNNSQRVTDLVINNRHIYIEEYFDDVVKILDKNLAKGLKDYVEEMKKRDLAMDETPIKRVGGAIVYSEKGWEEGDNYIFIKVNFSDIVDSDYREIYEKISDDKYILNNVLKGEKRNLIDFGNVNSAYYDSKDLNIRYNMFFKDKDLKKTNILLKSKSGMELKDEDMDVFINLLNTLELSGDDKGTLIREYRDILVNEKNKTIPVEGYNVFVKYKKGNFYGNSDSQLIYFSIGEKE